MVRKTVAAGLLVFAAACARAPARPSSPAAPAAVDDSPHVIVVSVDGLMPGSYIDPDGHGLLIPTLRKLAREGRASPGVQPVHPTVTYPSHTTMATGAAPARHGITTNLVFDPLLRSQGGWRWYAEDIRVPTLWDVAAAAGLRTALVNWPVTVGAHASALVPEYWRWGMPDDGKLTRALSTPGLLAAVVRRFPDLWSGFAPPVIEDRWPTDIAVYLIESERPNLLFVHLWMVDETEHEHGPWSLPARGAIEEADRQIARLIEAAQRAGIWERTLLMVVSDHGFAPVSQAFYPGVLLRQAGLVSLDPQGQVAAWKAAPLTGAGQAYIYLADPADRATAEAVRALFVPLAGQPGSGIATVYDADAIRARGGDPDALLSLIGAEGTIFAGGYAGDQVLRPTVTRGSHGFDDADPAMRSSLLLYGPGVAPGRVEGARLIDIGPTAAAWLGLRLPAAEGRALPLR